MHGPHQEAVALHVAQGLGEHLLADAGHQFAQARVRDPALADLIGNATRRAFTGIVELCRVERVDAFPLSGDLYDGDQTSMKTARFLADQIRLPHEAGTAVFIIRGSHDALSRITR